MWVEIILEREFFFSLLSKNFYRGSTAYIVQHVYVFNDSFILVWFCYLEVIVLLQLRQKKRWFTVHMLDSAMTENRTRPEMSQVQGKGPNGAFVLSKVILVIYLFLFLVVLGLCCCSGYSPVAVFRLLIVVASFAAELGH